METRIACSFPAELLVFCPECRSNSRSFQVTVVESGLDSVQLRSADLSGELFRLILRKPRQARLTPLVLAADKPSFPGRIAWIRSRGAEGAELTFALDSSMVDLAEHRNELARLARENPPEEAKAAAGAARMPFFPRKRPSTPGMEVRPLWRTALSAFSSNASPRASLVCFGSAPDESGAGRRRSRRIRCQFGAEFQLAIGAGRSGGRTFFIQVVEISRGGLRIRFREEDREELLDAIGDGPPELNPLTGSRGWMTLSSPCQRLSVAVRLVHLTSSHAAASDTLELGLAFDGAPDATRHARGALAEMASTHPAAGAPPVAEDGDTADSSLTA